MAWNDNGSEEISATYFSGNDESYNPLCMRQIHEDCNIPYSNMNNFRVCLLLANYYPRMLDWKLPENQKFPTAHIADVEDSQKYVAPLYSNLYLFQLITQGSNRKSKLTGAPLFDLMCLYHIKMLGREGAWKYEGFNHLDLSLGKKHMECIHPTKHKLKRGHIIWGAVGDGAALKVARGVLNTIRNMHRHCAMLNGAENLKRMRDDLQLTD